MGGAPTRGLGYTAMSAVRVRGYVGRGDGLVGTEAGGGRGGPRRAAARACLTRANRMGGRRKERRAGAPGAGRQKRQLGPGSGEQQGRGVACSAGGDGGANARPGPPACVNRRPPGAGAGGLRGALSLPRYAPAAAPASGARRRQRGAGYSAAPVTARRLQLAGHAVRRRRSGRLRRSVGEHGLAAVAGRRDALAPLPQAGGHVEGHLQRLRRGEEKEGRGEGQGRGWRGLRCSHPRRASQPASCPPGPSPAAAPCPPSPAARLLGVEPRVAVRVVAAAEVGGLDRRAAADALGHVVACARWGRVQGPAVEEQRANRSQLPRALLAAGQARPGRPARQGAGSKQRASPHGAAHQSSPGGCRRARCRTPRARRRRLPPRRGCCRSAAS